MPVRSSRNLRQVRRVSWKLLAGVLVLAIVIAGLAWWLWPRSSQGGEGTANENMLFKMDASFTYRGSADNLPIENVAIRFPCPNIDNVAPPTYTTWSLLYQDNNGIIYDQPTENQYRGGRTAPLEILLYGVDPTPDGLRIYYRFDKLYPGEIFYITTSVQVPEENSSKLTLKIYGDNQERSSGTFSKYLLPDSGQPFEFPIDTSFWAQLSKKVDNTYETVETFSRTLDNYTWGNFRLYHS